MKAQIRARNYGVGCMGWAVFYNHDVPPLNADMPDKELILAISKDMLFSQERTTDLKRFVIAMINEVKEAVARRWPAKEYSMSEKGQALIVRQQAGEIKLDGLVVDIMYGGIWRRETWEMNVLDGKLHPIKNLMTGFEKREGEDEP